MFSLYFSILLQNFISKYRKEFYILSKNKKRSLYNNKNKIIIQNDHKHAEDEEQLHSFSIEQWEHDPNKP